MDLVDDQGGNSSGKNGIQSKHPLNSSVKLEACSGVNTKEYLQDQKKDSQSNKTLVEPKRLFTTSVEDNSKLERSSLLSRKNNSNNGKVQVLNFSLLDGLAFDSDDDMDFEKHDISLAGNVQFNLLGTEEFEPVLNVSETQLKSEQPNVIKQENNLLDKECSMAHSSSVLTKNEAGDLPDWKESSFSVKDGEKTSSEHDGQTSKISISSEESFHVARKVKPNVSRSQRDIPLSQEASYLWKRKERKPCNVVGSDSEDPSFNTSESYSSSVTKSKNNTKTSSRQDTTFLDDDDDDFQVNTIILPQKVKCQQQKANEKKKSDKVKKVGNEFIVGEAEVSCDRMDISSDESEREDDDVEAANDSFVDDCTQLTQDAVVDMKAVYLKSIVSPVKKVCVPRQRPPAYLSDTDEHTDEMDEGDDSFVVDNDVVEYNTEYMGESLLAEDSIMLQAIHENFKCNKPQTSNIPSKNKRKRIILNDSTSEEENEETNKKKMSDREDPAREIKEENKTKENVGKSATFKATSSVISAVPKNFASKESKLDNSVLHSGKIIGKVSVPDQRSVARVLPMRSGDIVKQNEQSTSKPLVQNWNITTYTPLPRQDSEGFEVNPVQDLSQNKEKLINRESFPSTSSGIKVPYRNDIHRDKVCDFSPSTSVQSFVANATSIKKPVPQNEIPGLILVDSCEVNGGASIISKLKVRHGVNTSVVQLTHGHYAVSTRMIVSRLQHSVFSGSQHRENLKKRVQKMLAMFERSVIIVEMDRVKHGESPNQYTHMRSKYIDTITCACAQVTQLKVLYSKDQDETAFLLWQLKEQERKKGYSVAVLPTQIQQWEQVVNFYRSLPHISYVTALCLARNFRNLQEFTNSSVETIQEKGCMSRQRAEDLYQLLHRTFRADMLS